jgi:YfiH family protein
MTDRLGVALLLTFADCVPILVHDPVRQVVGLGHAGWRGTIAGVGRTLVDAMVDRYGSRVADLRVGIGPSIGPCCYEVGADVAALFRGRWTDLDVVCGVDGRQRVDLWLANRLDLRGAGVRDGNITTSQICTACQVDDYFSHRQQHGGAGRFAAVMALR